MRRGGGRHEKADFKYLKPLIKYLGNNKVPLLFAILFSICGTIFTIIGPRFTSQIADLISAGFTGDIDLAKITKIGIMLVCFYITAWILSYFQAYLMNIVTQRTSFGLRDQISRKINVLPLKFFDSNLIGDILSRIVNDVDSIANTMHQSVGNLFHAGTQFIGCLILMFVTNPILTLVALASAVLGFVLMILLTRFSQKYFSRMQKELGALNGHDEEIYAGHNVVKAYNAEEYEGHRFDEINARFKYVNFRAHFFGGIMQPIMGFAGNLGYVAVCIVGAAMVASGQITFGVVVAFMIYIRMFSQPLQQFGQVFTQLQSCAAASKRVFAFLEETELEYDADKPRLIPEGTAKGDIEFRNVKFGYNEDKIIIKNFSAKAEAGKKVAIVGPTGAGKTTMVNLLMRFYETNEGSIFIDGHDTKEMSRAEVHSLFGMVLQDTWLFEGTFKDNIKYNIDATDEQIEKAAKMAGIHHFIMTMPQGYDTILDEEANVSAGQKQLITIARAMVADAPFLILDEATSSVDTRTEQLIQDAMDRLMAGRTSFIIAHRLSTIKNADLILVMKEGDIIEQGSHDELIALGGFYADLYNSQFDQID